MRGVVTKATGTNYIVELESGDLLNCNLKGSFRFHEEFALGVSCLLNGSVDVLPLLSHSIPFEDAIEAFEIANDRSKSLKVQLVF